MSTTMTPLVDCRVERFRQFVRQHRVVWEVLPKRWPADPDRPRLGFEINIVCTHRHESGVPGVECAGCKSALVGLIDLSQWITPSPCLEQRDGGQKCDIRVRFSPRAGFDGVVTVEVEVLCRSNVGQFDCGSERSCLHEMARRLLELGARRIGSYPDAGAANQRNEY